MIAADHACPAAAVFTRSRFEGPSVDDQPRHVADGRLRAFTVVSRNANVATGEQGRRDAEEVVAGVAAALGCRPDDVLIASTGVIGRPYPMDRIRPHLADAGAAVHRASRPSRSAAAMMTTDTVAKVASASCGRRDHRRRGQGCRA